MTDVTALPGLIEPAGRKGPDLDRGQHPLAAIVLMGILGAGLLFVAYSIYADLDATGARVESYAPSCCSSPS
jgi:inorganic phosphate transporter, PiT family